MKAHRPAQATQGAATTTQQGFTAEDPDLLGNAFARERLQNDPLQDGLAHRTAAQTLRSSDVSTHGAPDVPLSREEVAELTDDLQGVGTPGATPIPDALAEGTASVGGGQIRMPGIGDASSGEAIREGASQMNPKDARVESDGERYDVFARLNPWVRIAGGSIAQIDAQTHHMNGPLRDDPAWLYLTNQALQAHGLTAGDLAVGQQWPPAAIEEDEGAAMEVEEEPATPLRDAFASARVSIEGVLGRPLTVQEWEVIADHSAESIHGMRNVGFDPVTSLSGVNGASCMPTADRLYALIGSGNEQIGVQDSVATGVTALANAIEEDDAEGLFYVKFGPNHGFVVLVSGGQAELVQSFAGDESLATNLETDGYTYSAPEIAGHLRNLMDEQNTAAAQEALFGDEQTIDENGHSPLAGTNFEWKRSDLPDDLEVVVNVELMSRAGALFDQ